MFDSGSFDTNSFDAQSFDFGANQLSASAFYGFNPTATIDSDVTPGVLIGTASYGFGLSGQLTGIVPLSGSASYGFTAVATLSEPNPYRRSSRHMIDTGI